MNALLAVTNGLTRWWVHLYTAGLPSESRFARRAEIESDLWEQTREAAGANCPPHKTGRDVLTRMTLGVPADLSWRLATPGIEREATGFAFVVMIVVGFTLGFVLPGKPDFLATSDEMRAFYEGKLLIMYAGHGLIWLSALFFVGFLKYLCDGLRHGEAPDSAGRLPKAVFACGVLAGALVVGALALTVVAATLARLGVGPQALPLLYPAAGYTFHNVASAAFGVTLLGVALASLRGSAFPASLGYISAGCAALLLLDAAGAFTPFVAQLCLLIWVLMANAIMMRCRAAGGTLVSVR